MLTYTMDIEKRSTWFRSTICGIPFPPEKQGDTPRYPPF